MRADAVALGMFLPSAQAWGREEQLTFPSLGQQAALSLVSAEWIYSTGGDCAHRRVESMLCDRKQSLSLRNHSRA